MIFIYIITPDKKTAKKISRILLQKKLVGCVNIFPIESMYWWKGRIENSKGYVIIAKTFRKNYEKVKKLVKENHPYEIPCICMFDVKINKLYEKWLKTEVK